MSTVVTGPPGAVFSCTIMLVASVWAAVTSVEYEISLAMMLPPHALLRSLLNSLAR